jgi:hypothetical protein
MAADRGTGGGNPAPRVVPRYDGVAALKPFSGCITPYSQKNSYGGDEVLTSDRVPLPGTAGGDFYAAVRQPDEEAAVAGVLIGEATEIEFAHLGHGCYRDRAFFGRHGRLEMGPGAYDPGYAQAVGP